jgi:hypothetical protein
MPTAMEGGLDETRHDPAESEDLVLPLEDREQHDGRADVRDDEDHFQ